MSPLHGDAVEEANISHKAREPPEAPVTLEFCTSVVRLDSDSAYLTEPVIRTVQAHHATFTIAAPKTIQWHDHLDKVEWTAWDYSAEQIT